ncbi:DUF6233 domain-containing protein [Streptomyces sp. NPDC001982]|uniref:DUF6233 domain-containing protein n=1 Tax=unclassified Streptomyces TaxID=2593676 RepID=UPI00332B5AF9
MTHAVRSDQGGRNNRHAQPFGGCWNAGRRSRGVPREQALRAPAADVPPCPQCRRAGH